MSFDAFQGTTVLKLADVPFFECRTPHQASPNRFQGSNKAEFVNRGGFAQSGGESFEIIPIGESHRHDNNSGMSMLAPRTMNDQSTPKGKILIV